jgi:hypothetical protein
VTATTSASETTGTAIGGDGSSCHGINGFSIQSNAGSKTVGGVCLTEQRACQCFTISHHERIQQQWSDTRCTVLAHVVRALIEQEMNGWHGTVRLCTKGCLGCELLDRLAG